LSSLTHAIAKVGGNTLISRILGFVRDLVIARVFGADAATDAFFVAFRIPNVMRRLFAEGAFSLAFVPVLNAYKERQGRAALKAYVDRMAGALAAMLLLVTVIGVLAAPALVLVFAPGFGAQAGQRELAIEMLRLTFPYVLFIALTAFAGGILNTHERFGIPAFTPVLLNLSLIACALFLAPTMERPIVALAWGVLIAGVAQLAFQLPALARLGLLPRPRLDLRHPGVRRTGRLMLPALLGASAGQLNLLIATVLASLLSAGSISWLYYADRLMEFPIGILGAALGTVILPRLSQRHAADDPVAFSGTIDWALRWVLLLGLPAAVGLAALAGPLIATLFYSGEGTDPVRQGFTAEDVSRTAAALAAYAFGLIGFMGVRVCAPGFYARQRMREPVRIGLIAVAVNTALSLILMGPLGHVGLALATTLSAFLNAGLLLRGLLREGVYRAGEGWRWLLARGLAASLLMGAAVMGVAESSVGGLDDWLGLPTTSRAGHLLAAILAGAAVYAAVLGLAGVRPRHLMEPPASSPGHSALV
jgi:putative peptidoglycan lipid II flippase